MRSVIKNTMNYQGVWIHDGNYGRILLVGDIYMNSLVPYLQKECNLPVDVVYAGDLETLRKLVWAQMKRFSYKLVIIGEGDIGGSAASLLPELRGAYARTLYILATTPPAWLKSAKYRNEETDTELFNQQCREMAQQLQIPCIDHDTITRRYGLESEASATYPRRFFSRLEFRRFHFSKIKKIRKEDATPGGRGRLTMRFFAFRVMEQIKQLLGKKPEGEVLWDNLQAHEEAPFLLIGDSNIRRIRSMNRELRSLSDALSMSADVLSDATRAQIASILKPHHKVVGICYGSHHLSAHYSAAFENQLRALFTELSKDGRKVVAINVIQRATPQKPHIPDAKINQVIQSLNTRFESVAREFGIPCIDAYTLMNGKTYEDKVHYIMPDYVDLSAVVLEHMKGSMTNVPPAAN